MFDVDLVSITCHQIVYVVSSFVRTPPLSNGDAGVHLWQQRQQHQHQHATTTTSPPLDRISITIM